MRCTASLGLISLLLFAGNPPRQSSPSLVSGQNAKPIARVYVPNGNAVIVPRDPKAKRGDLSPSEAVREGDRIEVKPNGSATVVFFKGGRFRIKPGRSATLEKNRLVPGDAFDSLPPVSAKYLKSLPHEEIYGATIIRGENPQSAFGVSPIDGSVIDSDRPSFSWRDEPGAANYRISVFAAAPDDSRPLLAADVRGAKFEWPKTARPLARDERYRWTVEAIDGDKRRSLLEASFTLCEEEIAKDLEEARKLAAGNDPADLLIAADIFRAVSADNLARETFRRLVELSPKNENEIYREILKEYDRLAGSPSKK